MSIRAKRGTKAQVDAAAGADGLQTGELIYLTDEQKFVGATGTGAYGLLGDRLGEYASASGGSISITGSHANKTLIVTGSVFDSTITLPDVADLSFPVGARITIVMRDSKAGLLRAPSGATITGAESNLVLPGCSAELVRLGASRWGMSNHSPFPDNPFLLTINFGSSGAATPSNTLSALGGSEPGDLWLIFLETAAQAITTPSGFSVIPGLPQTTGAAGGVASTALYGFYRIIDGTESPTITVAHTSAGDHQIYFHFLVKNVDPVTPFAATAGNVAASATTAVSLPTVTTARNDNLIINVAARAVAGSPLTGESNGNLSRLTVDRDHNVSIGNGGGLTLITGVKSAPGATGATTGTLATSSVQARWTGAINAK